MEKCQRINKMYCEAEQWRRRWLISQEDDTENICRTSLQSVRGHVAIINARLATSSNKSRPAGSDGLRAKQLPATDHAHLACISKCHVSDASALRKILLSNSVFQLRVSVPSL